MSKDHLLIDNQVCFSIYRLSKLITNKYRPLLEKLDITYPQYLVLMVLWQKQKINMRELGQILSLDNGTLTPLVKRLIDKGLVKKTRSEEDERVVYITTTSEGHKLKRKAKSIPQKLICSQDAEASKLLQLKELADSLYQDWSK